MTLRISACGLYRILWSFSLAFGPEAAHVQMCLLSSLLQLLLPFLPLLVLFPPTLASYLLPIRSHPICVVKVAMVTSNLIAKFLAHFPGCVFQAFLTFAICTLNPTVLTPLLFPADLLFSLLPSSAYFLMLVKPDSNHHSLPLMAFKSPSPLP